MRGGFSSDPDTGQATSNGLGGGSRRTIVRKSKAPEVKVPGGLGPFCSAQHVRKSSSPPLPGLFLVAASG